MALWQITGYRTAIDTEPQVRRAITLLRVRTGVGGGDALRPIWCGCRVPASLRARYVSKSTRWWASMSA